MLLPLVYASVFKSKLSPESLFLRMPFSNQTIKSFSPESDLTRMAVIKLLGPQLLRVVVHTPSGFTDAEKKLIVFEKIAQARWLLRLCNVIPWIKGVALTGSLAALDPKSRDDDLDLMIVCAEKRLWLVRPILVVFSRLCGRRRSWNREEPNAWCFNMWVEESSLGVDRKARNYYLANEVCQARWLISKDGVGERFLAENRWAAAWLPRLYNLARLQVSLVSRWSRSLPTPPPISWLIDLLNYLAYQIQLAYMQPHRTSEKVEYTRAFFHATPHHSVSTSKNLSLRV